MADANKTSTEELERQLLSGESWETFCDQLKEAGQHILSEDAPDSPIQVAEGYRYLTRLARMGLEMVLEYGNPAAPELFYQNPTLKSGGDNPDNIYYWARIRSQYEYRLDIELEPNVALSLNVYAGSLNKPGGRRIVCERSGHDIETDEHGRASLYLSTQPYEHGWVPMSDDVSTLLIRETVGNRMTCTPSKFSIHRIDTDQPPAPLDPARMARALRSVGGFVNYSLEYFMDIAARWRENPNTFFGSDDSLVGSSFGSTRFQYPCCYFSLAEDQALLIEFTPPPDCFWNVVTSNHWFESLDYIHRPVHVNPWMASFAEGQPVRIAIAARDPGWEGVYWLDSEEHLEGIVTLRFVDAPPQPTPEARVVSLDASAE